MSKFETCTLCGEDYFYTEDHECKSIDEYKRHIKYLEGIIDELGYPIPTYISITGAKASDIEEK